jgi:hypothetical protein
VDESAGVGNGKPGGVPSRIIIPNRTAATEGGDDLRRVNSVKQSRSERAHHHQRARHAKADQYGKCHLHHRTAAIPLKSERDPHPE